MSILIIRGPEATGAQRRGPSPLPREVLHELVLRAGQAGRVVALRACGSEQELLDTLRSNTGSATELALVDPGACNGSPRLPPLLANLGCAFIEVHDDRPDAPAACLPPSAVAPLAVVQGYGAQGYVMALAIALEELGYSECGNDFHVGT